jgi:hypothetical protein
MTTQHTPVLTDEEREKIVAKNEFWRHSVLLWEPLTRAIEQAVLAKVYAVRRVEAAVPVGYVYWNKGYAEGALDNQTLRPRTPLYTAPQPVIAPAFIKDGFDQVITERDEYHDIADELAHQIALITDADIGEHSSNNCPWQSALIASHEFLAQPVIAPTCGKLMNHEVLEHDY